MNSYDEDMAWLFLGCVTIALVALGYFFGAMAVVIGLLVLIFWAVLALAGAR